MFFNAHINMPVHRIVTYTVKKQLDNSIFFIHSVEVYACNEHCFQVIAERVTRNLQRNISSFFPWEFQVLVSVLDISVY